MKRLSLLLALVALAVTAVASGAQTNNSGTKTISEPNTSVGAYGISDSLRWALQVDALKSLLVSEANKDRNLDFYQTLVADTSLHLYVRDSSATIDGRIYLKGGVYVRFQPARAESAATDTAGYCDFAIALRPHTAGGSDSSQVAYNVLAGIQSGGYIGMAGAGAGLDSTSASKGPLGYLTRPTVRQVWPGEVVVRFMNRQNDFVSAFPSATHDPMRPQIAYIPFSAWGFDYPPRFFDITIKPVMMWSMQAEETAIVRVDVEMKR